MKTSHFLSRTWRNKAVFCWIRVEFQESMTLHYRLFRRSAVTRAVSSEMLSFSHSDSRDHIATTLRAARNALRERVDASDLKALLPEEYQ